MGQLMRTERSLCDSSRPSSRPLRCLCLPVVAPHRQPMLPSRILWIPATMFTVSISGTAGLKFAGSMIADGQTQEVSGTVPAQYEVTAHELTCSFKKTDAEGGIELVVSEQNGGVKGRCNTAEPFGGVRAEILLTHRDSTPCSQPLTQPTSPPPTWRSGPPKRLCRMFVTDKSERCTASKTRHSVWCRRTSGSLPGSA